MFMRSSCLLYMCTRFQPLNHMAEFHETGINVMLSRSGHHNSANFSNPQPTWRTHKFVRLQQHENHVTADPEIR